LLIPCQVRNQIESSREVRYRAEMGNIEQECKKASLRNPFVYRVSMHFIKVFSTRLDIKDVESRHGFVMGEELVKWRLSLGLDINSIPRRSTTTFHTHPPLTHHPSCIPLPGIPRLRDLFVILKYISLAPTLSPQRRKKTDVKRKQAQTPQCPRPN